MKIECKNTGLLFLELMRSIKKPLCNFELKMHHLVINMVELSLRVKDGVKRNNFKDMKSIKMVLFYIFILSTFYWIELCKAVCVYFDWVITISPSL